MLQLWLEKCPIGGGQNTLQNDNFHSYSTRNSQALRTPIGKSEAIYQTFTYIGSLAWNYISSKIPTDVSYICFKNYAKLHIQANSLPQIRLNV